MTHTVRGKRGACYLQHYDAMHTKIDIRLTPNDFVFDTFMCPCLLYNEL